MASAVQQRNSEDTLGEKEITTPLPQYPNSNSKSQEPLGAESKIEQNHIDEAQSYRAGNATPDVEMGRNHLEKKKLPSIFSPQLKQDRINLLKAVLKVEILLIVIVLGVLSIYWGGLASIEPNQRVLTVAVVDFDGQEVGSAFTSAGIQLGRHA